MTPLERIGFIALTSAVVCTLTERDNRPVIGIACRLQGVLLGDLRRSAVFHLLPSARPLCRIVADVRAYFMGRQSPPLEAGAEVGFGQ